MNSALVAEIRRISLERGYAPKKRRVAVEQYTIRDRQRLRGSGGKRRVRWFAHRMTDSEVRRSHRESMRRLRAARKAVWSYEI